jgi:sterol desaturase/sphingolipid hydroxylase (fatty acid hydroxylase superfamily)
MSSCWEFLRSSWAFVRSYLPPCCTILQKLQQNTFFLSVYLLAYFIYVFFRHEAGEKEIAQILSVIVCIQWSLWFLYKLCLTTDIEDSLGFFGRRDGVGARRNQDDEDRQDDWQGNVTYFVFLNYCMMWIYYWITFQYLTADATDLWDSPLPVPIYPLLVMYFMTIVHEVYFYIIHAWLLHSSFVYPTIHSVHHRTSALYAISAFYMHPLDALLTILSAAVPFVLLGHKDPILLFIWMQWSLFNFFWSHSDSSSRFAPKTDFHRRHHGYRNVNFSGPLTDAFFGTWWEQNRFQ